MISSKTTAVVRLLIGLFAFITGSVKEVTPVTRIGDTIIGGGAPGAVTKRMYELFKESVPNHLG